MGLIESSLIAQPTGGQVVAGTATFSAGTGTLTITQTSGRAIINWQDFSIAAGEFAKFVQPDATSATLNRVVSGLPSTLAGTLQANGRIFLINPNGILVGAGARIDTGGFLASTLDVANNEFLAGGDLHFTGGSAAAIKNLGAINALGGDVFLIARQVENAGAITAGGSTGLTTGGTIGLAAGSEVLLTTGGNERLFVQAASLPGTIINAGTITAATAELKAAGGNAYALAINNSGVVRATGSAVRNGQVWLVASGDSEVISSGTLVASDPAGAHGGEVYVLGGKVTLAAGALVDVSGAQGGGTALIGGDYQGGNPAVPNARTTVVEAGATIRADATTAGNGGKVIVWADGSTFFGGAISARGGAAGGDGGFAEVSGRRFLSFGGEADLRAPAGRVGDLLLDPDTLTLTASLADLNGDAIHGDDVTGNITSADLMGVTSFITAGQVASLLGSADLSLAATTAINVTAPVNWSSARSLTLNSGGSLNVNAAITNAGTGSIVLNAGTTLGLAANLSSAGAITLNPSGALTQTAGTVSAATLNLNGLGAVGTVGTPLATSVATIILNKTVNGTGAGATFVHDSLAVAVSGSTEGSLTLASASDITVDQNLDTSANVGSITLQADNNITVSARLTTQGYAVTLNSDRDGSGAGAITLTNSSIVVTNGGDITLRGGSAAFGALPDPTVLATQNDFIAGLQVTGAPGVTLGGGLLDARGASSGGNIEARGVGAAGMPGISNNSTVMTNGSGTVALYGLGGSTASGNDGVFIGGSVTTESGAITIYGLGRGVDSGRGVVLQGGEGQAPIQSASGPIGISGASQGSGGSNQGVILSSGLVQTTDGGNITLIGQGSTNGTTTNNEGVKIAAGSTVEIQSGADRTLTITGTGGTGTDNNIGVSLLNDSFVRLRDTVTGNSNMNITGTGGSAATGTGNWGVLFENGGILESLGDAAINVTGTGGGGSDSFGLKVTAGSNNAIGSSSMTGGITLTADTMDLGSPAAIALAVTTAGAVVVQTLTANTTAGLGAGAGGTLNLTDDQLGLFTAASLTLNTTGLGGDVTVDGLSDGNTTNTGPVTITAGGRVTFTTDDSTFNRGVTVNANDGIAVGADIAATYGNIVLDGNANSAANPRAGIAFTGPRTLTATTDFNVSQDPTQGSITLRNGTAGTHGDIASAALTLNASNGVTIADDLTATNGSFTAIVNPDGQVPFFNGTFTLASGKTLATVTSGPSGTSGSIDLTASSMALDGSLNSVGTASVNGSYNVGVGLGAGSGGLNLSDAQLGRITATGLTISTDVRGVAEITASGLTADNTKRFGPLTLTANVVWFEGTSVVGNRLIASGDGGVGFDDNANLSTSTAAIANPDITLSTLNIIFNTAVTVTAGGTGTLTLNPTGVFMTSGTLTLESGDNLVINRDLSVYGPLTLNADKNNDGTGTLTVANGVTVATTSTFGAQPINITAADLVLTGTGALNSSGATSITATAGRPIGLGATVVAGGLNLAGSELQQITATGLTLTSGGNITVDGITAPNSNNITGTTTLTANGVASQVNFLNTASTFHALTVNSTTTIANNATLTLDVGNLVLNAGTNISQTGAIEIGAGTANLTGATITLAHANNTMGDITVNSGAGDVSIREDAAISLAGITRTSGNLTLNAATDITQTGAISIATGAANLTAANITLTQANVLGAVTINAGTGNVALTEADAMAIAGITHTGTLNLTAAGAITDSGALVVSGTTTLVAGSANDITLDNANDFSSVVVTTGKNVTLNDINALALGNVTATGSFLATAAGNLTLNSGATISAIGAVANPLVLVAGGNFVNNSGAAALDAGAGRWLVYSTSPAGSTENGLTAAAGSTLPRLYHKTFAGNAPASIAAGNHLIYSTQPTLTVTAGDQTRAYGDANASFSSVISGFVSDDGVTDTATTAGLAGAASLTSLATATSPVSGSSFTITAAVGNLASGAGYAFNFADGGLTVTARPVTVTATAGQTKVYGAADPGTFAFTSTSLGSGIALSGSLTRAAGETVTGGPYAISQGTLTNANNSNYSLTYAGANFAITPATVTYTATAATRLVGASDPAFSGTVTGFIAGESQANATTGTMSFATTATVASVAGSYPLNGAGLTANHGNYLFTQAAGNATAFTIGTQAPLTITADAKSKTYGAALPAFTASFAGFVNGDTASSVTGLQFSTTATIGSNVGTFTITPFGATAPAAYLVGYVPGTLTINPATLTYTANAATRFFGASDPAFSGTVTGFVNGDLQGTATTGTLGFATTATVSSVAGRYPLNGAGLTANNGNYLFTQAAGNATAFTIGTQAPLTITADAKSKTYGAALPTFTATFAGFINGDTASSVTGLQFSTTATISSNVGTFTITPFGATAPASYLVGYVPGLLTINPATLTITANSASRTYGAANPAFSDTVGGFVNGDTSSVVSGLSFTTSATAASGVGAYTIAPTGAVAANYTLTFVPGTLTVNRASLTITAGDALRDFGAVNPAFSATFGGFVNGDNAAVVSGLTFTTPATATSVAGNYAITPLGATAANYTFAFVNGTLQVLPPTVMVVTTPTPVATINQQPVLASDLAVILQGGRLVLIPVDPQGAVSNGADSVSTSLDGQLQVELSEVTNLPRFASATNSPGAASGGGATLSGQPNPGGFEFVASLGGGVGGGSPGGVGGLTSAQMTEPGLFRESTVNMGGFKVVYHEALAEARQQAGNNTAQGSSYREFLDTENPRVDLVRATSGPHPGEEFANPAADRNSRGAL